MTLESLLSPERVIANLSADEATPALHEMVSHLVEGGFIPSEMQDQVLEALRRREEQRSTGIGNGIAIPHCFLENIDEVITVFARSEKGVDFCSLDRGPVHFIVLFIVPQEQYTLHLKTLAAIAKILNSADTRNNLAGADTPEQILEILSHRAAGV